MSEKHPGWMQFAEFAQRKFSFVSVRGERRRCTGQSPCHGGYRIPDKQDSIILLQQADVALRVAQLAAVRFPRFAEIAPQTERFF
nr:hypothetical protein [Pseudarthrobacter sp. IC2-21]